MGIATGIAIAGGVAVAAGAASSAYGSYQKGKAAKKALGTVEAGREYIEENVNIPEMSEKYLELKQLESQGQLSPEQETVLGELQNRLNEIAVDPRYKENQVQALNALQEVADQGGLTITDRAKLEQIKSEVRQQEKGSRDAILQNAAARGMSGSGSELAAQLAGEQGAANRLSQEAFNVGSESRREALQAKIAAGDLGGKIRSQEFGEQQVVKEGQNATDKFNLGLMQDVNQRNINRDNYAQEKNLADKQAIANANVNLANQQQAQNLALEDARKQQIFNNELAKAGAYNAVNTQVANAQQNVGNAQAGMWGGIGQGLTGIGTTMLSGGLGAAGTGGSTLPAATQATSILDKKNTGFDPYGNVG